STLLLPGVLGAVIPSDSGEVTFFRSITFISIIPHQGRLDDLLGCATIPLICLHVFVSEMDLGLRSSMGAA
ncbi:MAG TPA: hypothetical protein DDW98_05305, partial [Gammaproteobacteria bacterium]|nr:hypothetical protein [Gammaproteobacteria bacterium]